MESMTYHWLQESLAPDVRDVEVGSGAGGEGVIIDVNPRFDRVPMLMFELGL